MPSIWPPFELSSFHYCSSESQTSTLRLSARVARRAGRSNTQTGRNTCTCMHTNTFCLLLTPSHTHNRSPFFLPLSLSLPHAVLLPQESDLFIERLHAGVGGGTAVLFHRAQTGSQINIRSPASQLAQAGRLRRKKICPCGFTSGVSHKRSLVVTRPATHAC